MITTWVLISNVLLFKKEQWDLSNFLTSMYLNSRNGQTGTCSEIFSTLAFWSHRFRMQNLCFILEFHSWISWLLCILISAVVLWVFLDLSSSSAGHQRKLLALCDYMHIDALFTNKAPMNKILVPLLLVNMWALLHFWNVLWLPLQVLSSISSKFYCRIASSPRPSRACRAAQWSLLLVHDVAIRKSFN